MAIAILNTITKYKLGQLGKPRALKQILFWIALLFVLLTALPVYNYLHNSPLLQSNDLTVLDIIQTTTIVYLIYIINTLRIKIERTEQRLRDLHQELSIKFAEKPPKKRTS